MAELIGTITTGAELSGSLAVVNLSGGSVVTGNTIEGQIVGGPKGEKGDPGSDAEDKNYTQPFTSATSVSVTHNLGKRPSVTVVDSAGDEVEGAVNHISINELTITFTASFTGVVYVN